MVIRLCSQLILASGLALSGIAQAALFDRGGGLIYDDVLNVTWLQDANYAKTSGYDVDGAMSWTRARTWAANLVYYDSVRNQNLTGWRLPQTLPVNGAVYNYSFSNAGGTDYGYNISAPGTAFAGSPGSELAYMYYQNLANTGSTIPTGGHYPCYQTGGCLSSTGPFINVQNAVYWSDTQYAPSTSIVRAWNFRLSDGFQYASADDENGITYAWAVRPGDVAAVPEAESWMMLVVGLGLVGAATRRARRVREA